MKILQPGNPKPEVFKGMCPICQCKFEYDKSDIKLVAGCHIVVCPQSGCRKAVEHLTVMEWYNK